MFHCLSTSASAVPTRRFSDALMNLVLMRLEDPLAEDDGRSVVAHGWIHVTGVPIRARAQTKSNSARRCCCRLRRSALCRRRKQTGAADARSETRRARARAQERRAAVLAAAVAAAHTVERPCGERHCVRARRAACSHRTRRADHLYNTLLSLVELCRPLRFQVVRAPSTSRAATQC